ncbi:energy-coupling factor transporter transmembrane component T family protein [Desulfoluna butyratoxydans]|uniref:Abc/ecf transporter transmembrane component n=1 Tax=Desulfoluna butyratoxydans TaxID=231438 RepID=A0A4U8YQI4_9BACT|nr:energy-coupling factor transporter transmembrane component T [Desulfoluna butyratoxydans]VFQ46111.1 abc/ecf transporter transmembrane component [Desulfoluna butyratoxydans]
MRALFAADAVQERSHVHRLDVRTKILISLVASMAVIFIKSPLAMGFLALASALYVLELGRYGLVAVCYMAIGLMWVMALGFMALIHRMAPTIPASGVGAMAVPFLRTVIMINTVLALALSSRIQTVLTALKSFRLPIWIYIPAAVMIRFVPTFIRDVQQIHESMRIRGYNLRPLFIVRHPVLSVRLLVAPILFRALRSSDDLGIAAELKGVSRTNTMVSYKTQAFSRADAVAFIGLVLILLTGAYIQLHWGTATTGFMP